MRRLSSRMIESRQSLLAIDDKTSIMLTLVQSIPGSIADLDLTVTRLGEQQTKRNMQLTQAVTRLSSQVTKIFYQGDHTLQMIQHGGAQITRVMARVSSIVSDLRKLMYLYVLSTFSYLSKGLMSCSQVVKVFEGYACGYSAEHVSNMRSTLVANTVEAVLT